MRNIVACLICLFFSGCFSTLSPMVRIGTEESTGWGLVIASDRVVTPKHITDEWNGAAVKGTDGEWHLATLVRNIPADPEPLTEWKTDAPLPPPVRLRRPKAGDSGAPLIVNGEAIGLLYGLTGEVGVLIVLPN